MPLHDYQQALKEDIYRRWDLGDRNVMGVLPTGGGKTYLFSSITHDHDGASVAVAHRKELVSQISMAFARQGVRHGIIGTEALVKELSVDQMNELGTILINQDSPVKVASVDTMIRARPADLGRWANQVSLWVTDECHHLLRSNKWGKGVAMFPNARGLGVTATPIRADRKGLGSHADGVFDSMAVGPSMRELITRGFLTDYRVFAPPSDIDITHVETGADGDFKKVQLHKAVQESHIIGDIVDHYKRIAPGKLGITFVDSVDTATEVAAKYNASGVPAEVVSAKTPARVRTEILRRFKRRSILQLVNVDLFGEGFDLPAVEVVTFGRPTQSYALYVQQFGRALRVLEGKDRALIIDHVGNVVRHRLPDAEKMWSLDAGERSPRSKRPEDDIPLRYCPSCTQPYERVLIHCPFCGAKWTPEERSKPEYVDGDLFELSPEVLAQMRKEADKIIEDPLALKSRMMHAGAPPAAIGGAVKNHGLRYLEHEDLRRTMGWWSAKHHIQGRPDAEIQRRFYHSFGIDMLSAQALSRSDAESLKLKIREALQ